METTASSDKIRSDQQNSQRAASLFKVALAIGILAHLAGFAAFRVVDTVTPVSVRQQAFIRFENLTAQDGDRFFEEQAMLLDSEPLFLPTQWNYAARVRTEAPQPSPTQLPFEPFSETIRLRQVDFFGDHPIEAPVNTPQLIANIISDRRDVLSSVNISSSSAAPLTNRLAFIRFQRIGGEEIIVERVIRSAGDAITPLGQLWEPVELLMQIDAGGRMDKPVMVSTSGSEETDARILEWVVAPENIRGVPPGYYRVTAGP